MHTRAAIDSINGVAELVDKNQAGQESTKSLFGKIVVLLVFIGLMTSFIFYFNNSVPDIKYVAMENLQQRFSESVTNSHFQWQAEGRPQMIMLIHYEPRLGNSDELVETDRRPIVMSRRGYPKAEDSSEGCAKLWQMILNIPLSIDGFRVYAEYFADTDSADNKDDAMCRFRLSVGPYFEYQIADGQVSTIED